MDITDKGIENLREAIVKQAADDYLYWSGKLYRITEYGKAYSKETKYTFIKRLKEVRKFFRSRKYRTLCEIDGEYFLERLEDKFRKEIVPMIDEEMKKDA